MKRLTLFALLTSFGFGLLTFGCEEKPSDPCEQLYAKQLGGH